MAKAKSGTAEPPADGPVKGANSDVAAEIAKLRHTVELLEQGLTQLLEATSTHTEMLRALMAAATAPTEPEQNLAVLLNAVVARLSDQTVLLRSIGETMVRLPDDVGAAVGAQMASALAAVK
jgi:hypothetical protein